MKITLFLLIGILIQGCSQSYETKIHELETRNTELRKQVHILDSTLGEKMYSQADIIYFPKLEVKNPQIINLGDTLKSVIRFIRPKPISPTRIHIEGLEGLYQKKLKNDVVYEILYVPQIIGKLKYKGVLKVEVCKGEEHYPFEIEAQVK